MNDVEIILGDADHTRLTFSADAMVPLLGGAFTRADALTIGAVVDKRWLLTLDVFAWQDWCVNERTKPRDIDDLREALAAIGRDREVGEPDYSVYVDSFEKYQHDPDATAYREVRRIRKAKGDAHTKRERGRSR